MPIAVITGASSGLGRAYALAAAKIFPEIDEYWLVARRQDRLEALATELSPKRVRCLALDLSDMQNLEEYQRALEDRGAAIALLVNNAGFGWMGDFADGCWRSQAGMVDVNVRALTAIAGASIKHMAAGSVMVNVSSIAAFAPTPRMTVYCSTKAYISSFSKGLRYELKKAGINVLAACPCPMDTEFLQIANVRSRTFDRLPRVEPDCMAQKSLIAAKKGRAVYTAPASMKFYRVLAKILPSGFIMRFSKV
jgi:short-subunit dehydrogenase